MTFLPTQTTAPVNILHLVRDSFMDFGIQIIQATPFFVTGIVLIIAGWIFSKILSSIIRRVLRALHFDALIEKLKLDELLASLNIKKRPSSIVGKSLFYVLFFFFLVPAFQVMGLDLVSQALTDFIFWLPKLLVAIITFLFGYFIADFLRKIIQSTASSFGAGTGRFMGNAIFYFLVIIITITAINQTGINTDILNSNITIAIGGIILAFAIAYGFASRDLLASIISSFYHRKRYHIGQSIRLGDQSGTIESLDSVSVTLQTGQTKTVIPLSRMLRENVEILSD